MKFLFLAFFLLCGQAVAQNSPPAENAPKVFTNENVEQRCTDATFDDLKSAYNELEGFLNEAQENPAPFADMDLKPIETFVAEKGEMKQEDLTELEAKSLIEKINAWNNELASKLVG